jgi:putative peptidoglycan lipid II flippase
MLSREQTEILETALFSMVPVLLTKITGQFFNLIAASYFGVRSDSWNKFLIASTIPDLVSNVLIAGLLGSIVIPVLVTARKREGEKSFLRLYSTLINLTLIIFAVISFVLIIFAEQILPATMGIFSPQQVLSPKEISSIANMMRALLLPQAILAVSVFISSGLNLYNRYLVPQLAPLFYNIGRIFALVIIVPLMNYNPWGIVIGVYIGAVLHLLIQLPLAREVGLKFQPYLDLGTTYIKQIFKVSVPRTIALASEYLGISINTFIAYSIVGGPAAFNFANSISLFVPQLFAFTFAYASFKRLSEHFEEKNGVAINYVITKTFNEMIFLAMPFIVTFLVLRIPVTRLTFGLIPNTNLELQDTHQIAWVLLWFATGHIFVMGKWFMYKVFYAAKDIYAALIVSVIGLILTVVLSTLFTNLFSHNTEFSIRSTQLVFENFFNRSTSPAGVGGLALGMSIAYSIEFFLLFIWFNKKVCRLNLRNFFTTLGKKFIAGGVMMALMYGMFKIWDIFGHLPTSAIEGYMGSTTINLLFLTSLTVATSFMVYYLTCLLLNISEVKLLKRYLNPILRIGGIRIR